MKINKITLSIISLSMVFALSLSFSFATPVGSSDKSSTVEGNNAFKVFEKQEYTTIDKETVSNEAVKNAESKVANGIEQAVLYQNSGKPIEADDIITVEGNELALSPKEYDADNKELKAYCEKEGYSYVDDGVDNTPTNTFGVYIYKTHLGTSGEIIISANADTMSTKDISESIDLGLENGYKKLENDKNTTIAKAAAANPTIRTVSKTCKSGSAKVATITGSITFDRASKNAAVGKKRGSVWDVDMFVQVNCSNKRKVASEYAWLNTNQPNQAIVKYGPIGDEGKSGGYSYSLGGGGPVAVGFNVTYGGSYKRKDLTNVPGKYGKWRVYTDTTAMKAKLTTNPGIRCTNTKGSLIIKAKLEIKLMNLVGRSYHSQTFTWGTSSYTIKDR